MASSELFNESVTELFDHIEHWLQSLNNVLADAIYRAASEQNRIASCPTCTTPGCCYNKVIVSLFEVFPLARHLLTNHLDTPELRAKLVSVGNEMESMSSAAWLDQARPCIFLAEDGRCSIYRFRPIRCRDYIVFSDPKQCQPPSGKQVQLLSQREIGEQTTLFAHRVHVQALELKETPMRVLSGAFPRLLGLFFEALNAEDFREFIRRQPWPTNSGFSEWEQGNNPFRAHSSVGQPGETL